jgi:hypothetical protein
MRWRQKVIAVDHQSVDDDKHARTVQLRARKP